jgi:uncharacterized membrane protein (DUF485 family)
MEKACVQCDKKANWINEGAFRMIDGKLLCPECQEKISGRLPVNIFKELTKLSYKRSFSEALGFYLAYFILLLLLAFLSGFFIGAMGGSSQQGFIFGRIFGVAASLVVSFLVLLKKNKLTDFGCWLIVFLSGTLAIFGGILLGLIPTAYLTTIDS